MKFATGLVFDLEKLALCREQYGAGYSTGAAALVDDIRAYMTAHPEDAIVQVDQENAFGRVDHNDALSFALEWVP